MAVTDWLSIGSTTSFSVARINDIALNNPGNAFSDDNTYASADINATEATHEYNYFGFDFSSIPSNSAIVGIELRYMAYGERINNIDAYVSIYNNATATLSSERAQTMTTSEATYTEGGAADMWGLTFTQAQLANDDLYARIYFTNDNSDRQRFAYLDQIQVQVYYLEPNIAANLASLTTAIYGVTVDAGQVVTVNLLSLTTAAYSVTVSSGLTTLTNLVSLTTGTLSPTINLDYVTAVALQSLTVQVIGAAAQPYASSNVDLHDGLVSYWGLNELSGTRYDSVGANNLTASGGTPGNSTDTVASSTRSLQLDSQDYYANTAISGDFYLDEFSFSLWAKPVDVTTKASTYRGTAFLLRTSSSAPVIAVRLSGDTDDWEVYNWDNATVAATGSGSATTSWQMLSVTYSAANGLRFYVNGTLADTGGTYSYPTADQVFLGYTTTTFGYDGLIDEVGLWERELAQSEIDQLYNSGNGQTYPFNQFIHYQVANPAEDITTGQWTLSAGTNFYETLTDGTSGYAQIQGTAVNKTLELKLEPISEPLVDEGLIVQVYAKGGSNGANQRLIVQLYQGTTQIASKEFNSSESISTRQNEWDAFADDLYFSVPKASAANITDYTDLRVRFNVVNQISNETLEIYYVKLYAAPSGGQIVSTNATTDIPSGWAVFNVATAHAALADGENSTYVRSRDDVDPLLVRFAPLVDPGINVGLTILVGFKGAVANDFGQADGLSCALYQGTTSIATVFSNYESQVTGWVDHYIFQFDPLAITDITDFSNLNVRFSMGIKDSTEGYDIEYAYLFAPDPVYIATPALVRLTPAVYSVTIAVSTGSINAAGLTSLTIAVYLATVNTDTAITVGLTSLATVSYSVTVSAGVVTAVGLNTLTVTSYSTETNTNVVTATGLTGLTITPHSATVITNATIEVGLASSTIATYSTTVAAALTTETNLGQLSIAVYSTAANTDAVIAVGITSLTEVSYTPTAKGDATQLVNSINLTVSTSSPIVTGDAIVSAGLQSLTVTTITPSISDGASISVSVGICSNSITTLTPTVNYDYAVTTNPNGLTIGVLSTAVNTGATVSVSNLQTLTITGYGVAISGSTTNIVQIVFLSIQALTTSVSTQTSVAVGIETLTLSTITPEIVPGDTATTNLAGLTIANYGVTVNYGCMTDAGLQTLTLALFATTFEIGNVNVYDGNSFIKRIVKVFDGNNWVTRTLKHWDSSTWK